MVESGRTPTWAEALIAVPTTMAPTNAATEAARATREEATDAGRMNRGREMTVINMNPLMQAQRTPPLSEGMRQPGRRRGGCRARRGHLNPAGRQAHARVPISGSNDGEPTPGWRTAPTHPATGEPHPQHPWRATQEDPGSREL
jgi:hypothetical protein